MARAANPGAPFDAIFDDVTKTTVAAHLTDCDFLFLVADSMQARLLFNSVVHQYLIPGAQVGAKVVTSLGSGDILDVFAVYRPVTPDAGCLWCNGLINTARLQEEALSSAERAAQRYVQEATVVAPSVITLNSVAAAHAANDFLFSVTGLHTDELGHDYLRWLPRSADVRFDAPRRDGACPECGADAHSRLARGDARRLPTRT
ncbi:ThiF family adenylyltransferase [Catenulispora rubra]|uniref:ThiF family adenylyltransferase n=1 Tax=Catenulispora rubra TaxID=280293 RepID=UPI0018920E75|nr:ThiF family adenylyltransferase [Catenulispora rubra]